MKAISENVKNAFKQPTTKRKGVILVNGTYYDIYNVEYYADCYDEGKVIGNAIASQLDFDIPYMEKFDTFQYFDCICVDDSYEYIDYGTFTVFDEQDQDEFNKHITAFDNLIKFNKPFENVGGYPKTLYAELLNICQQADVVLANLSIPNGDFIVENNQFVSGESLKTVLKQICTISGNYGIVKNNVLYLQLKNTTNEAIDKSQHEPVDWKRRSYGINQVILGDSQIEGEYVIREDAADIALNGVHKLEILDNLFAYTQDKRNALIDNLFNQVKGFGYIPFETKGEWLSYLEIGDTINLDGIDTILLRINAKSPQALDTTMSAPAIIDSSIKYVDNTADVDNRLKLTERSVDKQNQIITDVVSTVDSQNTKISQITQTVDEINAKISDITDITISAEDTDGQVELDNVNESEPIQIKIHPIGENIGYDYPHNDYPQNDYSKIRTIRFTRTYTEEGVTKTQIIPYELPCDLLYYDQDTYDEFYLDYDSQTCQVTKRCVYNSDGTVSPLATEQVIPYEYPTINLGTGDYTVCLLGYSNAYIMVRLMASNIYTTQFATKVEMNSAISQTAEEINLEVSRKVGKDEVISRINQSAEAITINANKISLAGKQINLTSENIVINSTNFSVTRDGNITAKGGTIGGWTINTNSLHTANNNYYLGTTGITATIGDTTVNNIIFKAGNKFGVSSGGTLYAQNAILADANISGTVNANSGNISGNLLTSGTITGAGINIYNGTGFLKMIWDNNHPFVSALNVGLGSGGISFRNSGDRYNVGSEVGHIYGSSAGNVVIEGNAGTWIQDINIQTNYIMNCYQLSGISDTYLRLNYSVVLKPNAYGGAYIWGTEDYNKILTVGGSPSTLSIKENVREKETNDIPNMLTKIKLYDYNYIKEINNGKEDYGYIIDYLENIDGIDKYFVFNEVERNGLKYKTINHEHLSKFLLGAVIELQKEINSLKEENNE